MYREVEVNVLLVGDHVCFSTDTPFSFGLVVCVDQDEVTVSRPYCRAASETCFSSDGGGGFMLPYTLEEEVILLPRGKGIKVEAEFRSVVPL